jgi:hypothetical protein
MANAKFFPGQGKWDPINSTYRHDIILLNGYKITGYSKGLLHSEMQDKIVLLQRIILRLYKSDKQYFSPKKLLRIEFYKRDLLHEDELIFILGPDSFQFGNSEHFIMNESLNQFLVKFYKAIKEGKIISKELFNKPKYQTEADAFSLKHKRFLTEPDTLEYCFKKIREGFPEGLVMNFFRNYRSKYLTM